MKGEYPESKIAMLTVFPPGMQRETLQKILTDRWKVGAFPAYLDDAMTLFEVFEVEGVPSSVLFDSKGNAVKFFVGMPDHDDLKEAFDGVLK